MPSTGATAQAITTPPFSDAMAHLLAELEWVDLVIHDAVARARRAAEDERFSGLCISEDEVDALLARPAGLPRYATRRNDRDGDFELRVEALRSHVRDQAAASAAAGVDMRLRRLAHSFKLDDTAQDLILFCLAPELDLRYERLYAYLQDDVTRKRPAVDLLLNLRAATFRDKIISRRLFMPGSVLLDARLCEVFEDPSHLRPALLNRYVRLEDRVTAFLLGSDALDPRLSGSTRLVSTGTDAAAVLPPRERERVARLAAANDELGRIIHVHGPYGAGKLAFATAFCAARGRALLAVDGEALLGADPAAAENLIQILAREARLQQAGLYWGSFDSLLADDRKLLRRMLLSAAARLELPVFLAGEQPWEPRAERQGLSVVSFGLRAADYSERTEAWTRALLCSPCNDPVDPADLAARFRFTTGQISDAVASAHDLARARDPANVQIGAPDLFEASRLQATAKLGSLGRKLNPRYQWTDIVLPRDRIQQLREVCGAVRFRPVVLDDWGFDRKLSLGKGVNVLFAGPPGTGKTMAAEVIARELSLDIYKIDLSSVVSKYIGETEKNLAKIFAEAENSNAILFFDEADALFGKRSEVKDSHDRYANIEISYLLQKMEECDGIVILATNLRSNMDEAFVRRMQFTVEFPLPDERHRRLMWQQVWPDATPRGNDVDLRLLARRFEITGANIRNIALASAFLAAADGRVVNMQHVLHATRRELKKIGKLLTGAEFDSG
jgi:MoxR-like ATPase